MEGARALSVAVDKCIAAGTACRAGRAEQGGESSSKRSQSAFAGCRQVRASKCRRQEPSFHLAFQDAALPARKAGRLGDPLGWCKKKLAMHRLARVQSGGGGAHPPEPPPRHGVSQQEVKAGQAHWEESAGAVQIPCGMGGEGVDL